MIGKPKRLVRRILRHGQNQSWLGEGYSVQKYHHLWLLQKEKEGCPFKHSDNTTATTINDVPPPIDVGEATTPTMTSVPKFNAKVSASFTPMTVGSDSLTTVTNTTSAATNATGNIAIAATSATNATVNPMINPIVNSSLVNNNNNSSNISISIPTTASSSNYDPFNAPIFTPSSTSSIHTNANAHSFLFPPLQILVA